jgi:succinyl-CoA synthetase alpha subunit
MSILVDADTRILCQGFTGRQATFFCDQAMAYGSQVVAGVTPGRGGQRHLNLPVFDEVAQAAAETGADTSVIFVPPRHAASAMLEAIEAGMRLVVCVTEGVPVLDMVRVRRALEGSSTRLLGPNSIGLITPSQCKIGVMPGHIHAPGCVGIVSRSGTLTYEAVTQTTAAGLGQSTVVSIGADPVHGLGFVEVLEQFAEDPDTRAVILVGEIGGTEEEDAAVFIEEQHSPKPVVGLVAGITAPQGRRMGHAGAIISAGQGTAAAKIAALRAAGVHVASSPAALASSVLDAL